MRHSIISVAIALCCTTVFAAPKSKGHPDAVKSQFVMQQVQSNGAEATVHSLHDEAQGHRWKLVLRYIESGRPEWLTVAKALSRGLDSETGADMRNALAKALPANPGGVLGLIDGRDVIDVNYLCGVPFSNRTAAFLKKYRADATGALKKLKASGDMETYRTQCIGKIERSVEIERLLQLGAPRPTPAPTPAPMPVPTPPPVPPPAPETPAPSEEPPKAQ